MALVSSVLRLSTGAAVLVTTPVQLLAMLSYFILVTNFPLLNCIIVFSSSASNKLLHLQPLQTFDTVISLCFKLYQIIYKCMNIINIFQPFKVGQFHALFLCLQCACNDAMFSTLVKDNTDKHDVEWALHAVIIR